MKFSEFVGYDTRNKLEHCGGDRFNPLDTGFLFSICLVRVCWQHHAIPDGWTFINFSGYGHKSNSLYCFTRESTYMLFKLGVVEVCALGVLLVKNILMGASIASGGKLL